MLGVNMKARVELYNMVGKGFNLGGKLKREFESKYNEVISQRVCISFSLETLPRMRKWSREPSRIEGPSRSPAGLISSLSVEPFLSLICLHKITQKVCL